MWSLIKDLVITILRGLGRSILIILSATFAGALIGAGAGFFTGQDILTTMIIGAVVGCVLSLAILFLVALNGPY
ncbi:MAG: hypothetical protein AAF198_01735 [Pseudomonadota bacterium]